MKNNNIDYVAKREQAIKAVESGKYDDVIKTFYKGNVEWFIDDTVYNTDSDFQF